MHSDSEACLVGSTEITCASGFGKYKALLSTVEPMLEKKGNLHGNCGLDIGLVLNVYAPQLWATIVFHGSFGLHLWLYLELGFELLLMNQETSFYWSQVYI